MTALDAFVQLDKTITGYEHSLLMAERLKAQGRWRACWDAELTATRAKLANAHKERDALDAAILGHSHA